MWLQTFTHDIIYMWYSPVLIELTIRVQSWLMKLCSLLLLTHNLWDSSKCHYCHRLRQTSTTLFPFSSLSLPIFSLFNLLSVSFLFFSLFHSLQQSAFCSVYFNSLSVLSSFSFTLLVLCVSLSCFCQREMTPLLKILVDRVIAQHICLLQTIQFFPPPFPCEL